jgi:hypothetical protein
LLRTTSHILPGIKKATKEKHFAPVLPAHHTATDIPTFEFLSRKERKCTYLFSFFVRKERRDDDVNRSSKLVARSEIDDFGGDCDTGTLSRDRRAVCSRLFLSIASPFSSQEEWREREQKMVGISYPCVDREHWLWLLFTTTSTIHGFLGELFPPL